MKTWKLTLSHKDPTRLVLIGPYDEDFKTALMELIPYDDWAYRKASQSWLVSRDHEDALRELIDEHTAANDPSDLVGLPVLDEGGKHRGTVASAGSEPHLHVRVSQWEGVKTYDELRKGAEQLGAHLDNAQIWEALELVGKPASVVVREVDGKIVVFAELEAP